MLALTCACALLAAPATAAIDNYYGVIGQSPDDFAVAFNLKSKKNNKGKQIPVAIPRFQMLDLPATCPDGPVTFRGGLKFPAEIPVTKRNFTAADIQSDRSYEISGRVARNGTASGTVRITLPVPQLGGTCDSGVVSWTAAETNGAY